MNAKRMTCMILVVIALTTAFLWRQTESSIQLSDEVVTRIMEEYAAEFAIIEEEHHITMDTIDSQSMELIKATATDQIAFEHNERFRDLMDELTLEFAKAKQAP